MSSALTVTRRLTRAVLGVGAFGTLALAGHLALAHASQTPSPTSVQTPSTGGQSGVGQPGTGPAGGRVGPQGQTGGFGQVPGVRSGGSGSGRGSTTTHGS